MYAATSPLIRFYAGEGTDHKGRAIDEIWSLSHFWLEHTHDYMQWLFPIPESGRFNGFAPLLGNEERTTFVCSEELRQRQRKSLVVMLGFFGLQRDQQGITATPHLNINEHIWLKRGGHNHFRLSRIICSLQLCSQPELACDFQQAAIEIGTQHGLVSDESVRYWQAAIME